MMLHPATMVTIILMASVTYMTRILGYAGLRKRDLSPRALAMMEAAPGCVLISVIAPCFVSKEPANLIALAVTMIAALRLPMLPTVLIGAATGALGRQLIG